MSLTTNQVRELLESIGIDKEAPVTDLQIDISCERQVTVTAHMLVRDKGYETITKIFKSVEFEEDTGVE